MIGRKEEQYLRTKRVVVHVTEAEKELLKEQAQENGVNVSEFIRLICLYKYKKLIGGIINE